MPSSDTDKANINQKIRQANVYLREARGKLAEAITAIENAKQETYTLQGLQEAKVRTKLSGVVDTVKSAKTSAADVMKVR